jgi:hypothetical protein
VAVLSSAKKRYRPHTSSRRDRTYYSSLDCFDGDAKHLIKQLTQDIYDRGGLVKCQLHKLFNNKSDLYKPTKQVAIKLQRKVYYWRETLDKAGWYKLLEELGVNTTQDLDADETQSVGTQASNYNKCENSIDESDVSEDNVYYRDDEYHSDDKSAGFTPLKQSSSKKAFYRSDKDSDDEGVRFTPLRQSSSKKKDPAPVHSSLKKTVLFKDAKEGEHSARQNSHFLQSRHHSSDTLAYRPPVGRPLKNTDIDLLYSTVTFSNMTSKEVILKLAECADTVQLEKAGVLILYVDPSDIDQTQFGYNMNCYKISECQLDDTVKDCLRIEHLDCDLCDIKKAI